MRGYVLSPDVSPCDRKYLLYGGFPLVAFLMPPPIPRSSMVSKGDSHQKPHSHVSMLVTKKSLFFFREKKNKAENFFYEKKFSKLFFFRKSKKKIDFGFSAMSKLPQKLSNPPKNFFMNFYFFFQKNKNLKKSEKFLKKNFSKIFENFRKNLSKNRKNR